MKIRTGNIITLAFLTSIIFISVGSNAHNDPECRYEWESALSKAKENLSIVEFEKEVESIVEPRINLFITGGSFKALLQ